jgi:PAS domain S-box-containing protein
MKHEIGPYLISPLFLVLVLVGIAGLIISVYLLKYRKSPAILYLSLMQFSTAAWAFFYSLEFAATELSLKIFWSKFSYFGILSVPVFFYFFSLYFSSKQNKLTPALRLSLLGMAGLFLISVFTNDYHLMHWKSFSIDPVFNTTIYEYGISFWLVFVFSYGLLALSIANIFPLIFRFPEDFQVQILLLVAACAFPVVGNVMYVFNVSPIEGFDWTPVFFVFSGMILSYINVRFGTFDLIPFARNKLIDIHPDGIIVVDKHHRIADVNPAFLQLVNQKKELLLGAAISEVFPQRKSLIDQFTAQENMGAVELESDISGAKKYFEVRVSSLFDKKHALSGWLVVLRDITVRTVNAQKVNLANKQLTLEIAEKEKLIADLEAFDHTVAHDLNNVIGSIITATDLLQYELEHKNYKNMEEVNELIKLSAVKSFHVIKELLVLASVRQQDVTTEKVDMGKAFVESEKRISDMAKSSNAQITKPRDWPSANGYAPWIEEVWVNYLSNAIKYGGHPPVIELGATQLYAEKKVRYWIKDNGNGLTKKEQEKLFKKYERFNQTRIEGNGLGLSIVKRIVEKLNGEVGVISNAIPGEGCLFYFTLPCD